MSSRSTRALTVDEVAAVDRRLADFRLRYPEWTGMTDWELLEFARYEGVADARANEVEPIVLGSKCVALYGCSWCMINVGHEWRLGVAHDELPEPIDLSHFNAKRLKQVLSRRWQQKLFGPAAKAH